MFLSGKVGESNGILEIVAMLVVFSIILFAAYLVSKYFGKFSLGLRENSNIKIIETFRLSQDKYLQIIEVSDKYLLLGITKNNINLIKELEKEEISKANVIKKEQGSFGEFFVKTLTKNRKG